MSIPKADKWIQVEWNTGEKSVVNVRYLVKSLPAGEELRIGTVVTVGRKDDGTPLTATVLTSARERHQLDQPVQEEAGEAGAGTSAQKEETGDYSPSASDWEPSGESSSEESEEEGESQNVILDRSKKVRQYPNKTATRKAPTPTHRPTAVVPNNMQALALQNLMKNRKRKLSDIRNYGVKTQADSTRKHNGKIKKYHKVIKSMKALFQDLFRILREVNPSFNVDDIAVTAKNMTKSQVKTEVTDQSINNTQEIEVADEKSENEYSDRSDDNVLITNKYDKVTTKNDKADKGEWIPIGSGTTLIHKDKFRKVNWKSYTIATRTLLLAAFSRRTLATHSLTGKKSPAFSNKPAKMCLDPKIVSDIVIEITDKFKVKDNLVRSIITTKCADECKMQKMKMNKKKAQNQENVPPTESNKK